MPSAVEIANLALYQIGDSTITSFDDGNNRANIVKAYYPVARDSVLEEHSWNFAEKRATLARVGGSTPEFDFDYFYQIPTDCLRVRKTDDSDYEWKVEGDKLLSDATIVKILYTKKEEDTNRFSPLFVEALMYKLASLIAEPIRKDKNLAEHMIAKFKDTISIAKGVDAVQGKQQEFIADELTSVR